jgi:hypothetical protein
MADLKQSSPETLGVLDVLETVSWQTLVDGKIQFLIRHDDQLS